MLGLIPGATRGLHLLCLGAHPDDIEIGAGGTVLQLAGGGRLASATWVVLSGAPDRVAEGRAAAEAFLEGVAARSISFHGFRDGYFPATYDEIKRTVEGLKTAAPAPDVILAPRVEDAHQDHRLVAEIVRTVFRSHLVLEYEIVKYDGDLTTPNAYVALDAATIERKIDLLFTCFPSQVGRTWFDAEAFRGLARIRGIEAGSDARYAEGFHVRNARLAFGAARDAVGPGAPGTT
jgi:LmbE family N-acetylglucosaminyl deacetylase